MFDFLNRKYPFNDDIRFNIRTVVGISLGIFLFYLFFQPIEIQILDFNMKLLFFLGFGIIVFTIMGICLILLPNIFPNIFFFNQWKFSYDLIFNILIWLLIGVSNCFYIFYVGKIELTLSILFRVTFLSLAPVVILIILNQYRMLKTPFENEQLIKTIDGNSSENQEIIFESENQPEKFVIQASKIIFLRSANNYVEIVYEGEKDHETKKALIRNTLKNTELKILNSSIFVKCHRSCIININRVERITGSSQMPKLKIKNSDEKIPISRQYLLIVKEAISQINQHKNKIQD